MEKILSLLGLENDRPEKNRRGNDIYHRWLPVNRYFFDRILMNKGFKQFDTAQDASYFGVWVSPEQLCSVSYVEGDVIVVCCQDKEHYNAEIKACIDCYEPGTIAVCIDETGERTVYRQDRSVFFVE